MNDDEPSEFGGAGVAVDFVRHRNTLVARGELGTLFTDYYLHLADQKLRYSAEQDALFKAALAAFTLHCASRPLHEHLAWTLNFQVPRLNLFLAGDNEDCTVTGRLFTENVKVADHNLFYSDIVPRRGAETRRSVVNFHGSDVFAAASKYYSHSEQRPARYFDLGGDDYAMLGAHPDYDAAWFTGLNEAGVRTLARTETLARIERRFYRWHCGCTQQKILAVMAPTFRVDPDGLFGGGETIRVECPRCAAVFVITRESMESYLAHSQKGGA